MFCFVTTSRLYQQQIPQRYMTCDCQNHMFYNCNRFPLRLFNLHTTLQNKLAITLLKAYSPFHTSSICLLLIEIKNVRYEFDS